MPRPVRFGIVGSGWRSEFLLRIAAGSGNRLVPSGVVVRNPARRGVFARWGVPVLASVDQLLDAAASDFVVAAVDWVSMPGMIERIAGAGVHVLAETPPAPDVAGLRSLWDAVGASPLVQVAEQYLLMPGHAARLAAVRSGVIGQVTGVEVASTHMYHAVSLIRRFLDAGDACPTVLARRVASPLADPIGGHTGAAESEPRPRGTTLGILDFGGGYGLYDFVDNQWWNPLRARRIVIRGTHGEIVDDRVIRLAGDDVIEGAFGYRRLGVDLNLEGNELASIALDGRAVWRNAWPGSRFSEDDLAVADLLAAEGAYTLGDGPAPYPLAEACQDHAIALAVEDAAASGALVTVAREAWADQLTRAPQPTHGPRTGGDVEQG